MPNDETLSDDIATLLARLAEGWEPVQPRLSDPMYAFWNRYEFPGNALSLDTTAPRPLVRLRIPALGHEAILDALRQAADLSVFLGDGSLLELPQALISDVHTRNSLRGPETLITFHRQDWRWRKEPSAHQQRVTWITDVPEVPQLRRIKPNTIIKSRRAREDANTTIRIHTCHAFQGTSRYFLVPTSNIEVTKCAIAQASTPENWIQTDRIILSLALGRRLGLAPIHGVDEDGNTVEFISRSLRPSAGSSDRSRIPSNDQGWLTDFHDRLASAIAADKAGKLMEAIALFVDGFDDTLSGEFLKSHTAIIAAVRAIAARHDQVRQLLLPGETSMYRAEADILAQLLENNAPNEFIDLLAKDPTTTVFELWDTHDVGFKRAYAFGTLFMATAAVACDYRGPLSDSLVHKSQSASWWPYHEENDARKILRGTHVGDEVGTRPQWPTFRAPEASGGALIQVLVTFANDLADRTGGVVIGDCEPQPREDGHTRYDFKLILRRMPNTQIVLFSIDEIEGILHIEGWRDEPITLRTISDVFDFAQEVAEADHVQAAIERYLLTDKQISRGDQ